MCVFFFVWLFLALAASQGRSEPVPVSPFIQVSETVRPAVVSIRTIRSVGSEGVGTGPLQEMYRRFFPDGEGEGGRFENPSTGSGFVIDAAGDILTNHHVIDGADEIFVRFGGERREYRAELVGTDPNTDLALLRIDPRDRVIPALTFGDSDALAVGAWAIAVGNPFGNLESSLTVGVVSAKGRGDLVIGGLTPRFQDFIQTDASINFGNSGGPLVDVKGLVIGVNTAINQRGQGIGFAVPSNLVARVYEHLRLHGRVIRGYVGMRTEDLVSIVGEEAGDGPETGARILSVVPDSPAEQAGLRAGDVVVEYGGQVVDTRRDLLFRIAGTPPGEEAALVVVRDGVRKPMVVRPVEWQGEGMGPGAEDPRLWLGLEVASVDGPDPRVVRLKETLGIEATQGLVAVVVQEDGPAAEAGIRPGDVLVTMEDVELTNMAAWAEARMLFAARGGSLTVLVRTGSTENYVMVTPRAEGLEN